MRNVKSILIMMLALVMTLAMSSMVFAEGKDGTYTFNGTDIVNDEGTSIVEKLSGLEPGDSIDIELEYVNDTSDTTEWYMQNEVLKTLEEGSDAANGGYTYVLTNVGPDGEETEIFNSDKVGGEDTTGGTGLEQATNGTDDWFFIQELKGGESGKTLLSVELDGETQVNTYQDTDASLDIIYAVEKVKDGETIVEKVTKKKTITKTVNTGDTTSILPMVILFVAAALMLVLAILNHRKDRKDGEEA